jgi:hypothetical protein
MPSAIAVPIRQQMVELREQGKSYREIAQQLGQSEHSVRQICRRWRTGGREALEPNYERCGHHGVKFERLVWRSAIDSLTTLSPTPGASTALPGCPRSAVVVITASL